MNCTNVGGLRFQAGAGGGSSPSAWAGARYDLATRVPMGGERLRLKFLFVTSTGDEV